MLLDYSDIWADLQEAYFLTRPCEANDRDWLISRNGYSCLAVHEGVTMACTRGARRGLAAIVMAAATLLMLFRIGPAGTRERLALACSCDAPPESSVARDRTCSCGACLASFRGRRTTHTTGGLIFRGQVTRRLGHAVVIGEPYVQHWTGFSESSDLDRGLRFASTADWRTNEDVTSIVGEVPVPLAMEFMPYQTTFPGGGRGTVYPEGYPANFPFKK